MNIYHVVCETESGYELNSVCSASSELEAISLAGWDDDFYQIKSITLIGTPLDSSAREYATEAL